MTSTNARKSDRPRVAFLLRSFLPYNQHLCRRVAREIPQVQWHFVFTASVGDWQTDWPDDCIRYNLWETEKDSRNDFFAHLPELDLRAAIISGYYGPATKGLARYCRRRKIPFFIRADSNILGNRRLSIFKRMVKQIAMRWLYRGLAGGMPMGRLGREYFRNYGVPESKTYLVPHEPDYSQFGKLPAATIEEFRKRFGLTGNRRRIICCNRLVQVKRVDLVIDAFAALARQHADTDLVIVGDGPLEQELKKRVSREIVDRVFWLGRLQLPDVIAAYQSSDVFVLASEYEPWAAVIGEAAACELPIVASDVVGAAREVIENGVGGRLFRSGDVRSLEQSLRDVLDNSEKFRDGVVAGLANWRRVADPVAGIVAALTDAGVLPHSHLNSGNRTP